MKKYLILCIVSISSFLSFGVGVDFGTTVDSFSGLNIDSSTYVFGFEKVSLYGSLKVSDELSLAVDGFYKFSYKSDALDDNGHIFDLTTLMVATQFRGVELQLGRLYMSDYSGDIISHSLDGITFVLPFSFGVFNIKAGYSGFIHRDEYHLVKSIQDDYDKNERQRVRLAIGGADFIKDFESISFWISLYTSQDLRPENFIDNSSYFLGGGVNGSFTPDIFYSVRGNFKSGFFSFRETASADSEGAPIIAGMGVFNLDWYLRDINPVFDNLSPSLSLAVGVSSGDSDLKSRKSGSEQGDISTTTFYSPLTSSGPGAVFSISNQNLTYGKLVASVVPFEKLQAQLSSTIFFRTVDGVTGSDDVDITKSGNYLGSEVNVSLNYRPFSDLGVSVSSGAFFPNENIIYSSGVKWITSAYVSLSL